MAKGSQIPARGVGTVITNHHGSQSANHCSHIADYYIAVTSIHMCDDAWFDYYIHIAMFYTARCC